MGVKTITVMEERLVGQNFEVTIDLVERLSVSERSRLYKKKT